MKNPPPLPSQNSTPRGHTSIGDDPGIRALIPIGRTGWSIAAGYLGLFSLIILPGPIALIISLIAIFDIRKAKKQGVVKRGMGRAVFGLIMGLIATALLVVFIIASLLE